MLSNTTNVYSIPLLGAIYEIIWLPLVICLFLLPVVSFILWKKDRYTEKSKFLYLIMLSVLSIASLFTIFS